MARPFHLQPNSAFESGRAEKLRAFDLRPWWRAAQRERKDFPGTARLM